MKKAMASLQKNYYKAGLFISYIVAFILRILFLSDIPNILHIDEAGLGYNAWCLAHYGIDRYLNKMPIYPQNYVYGGQSPLYTYLVSLLILTVGKGSLSLFIVRLPGLLFSMLIVIFSTKTIHLVFRNRNLTLACSFLVSVLPYPIMQGRIGYDCNLMFGCCVIAMYSLVKYTSTEKTADLCICGTAFGLVMYSYAPSYIFVPLFLSLSALYLLYVRKLNIRRILLWAGCVCVSCLPILLFIMSLLLKLEPFKFLCFYIYPFASGRATEVSLEDFWSKVWHSIQITLTHGGFIVDSVPKFGTMYSLSIPFILVGFLISLYHFGSSLRKRRFHHSALFILFYVTSLVTMGLVDAIEIYRANFFFAAYIYFLLLGIYSVYGFIKNYRRAFVTVLAGGYLIWAFSFIQFYFHIYKVVIYPHSLYFIPAVEAIEFSESELSVETIYIDAAGFSEVQLFFSPISPYEWTETQCEGGYGRYNFVINGDTDLSTENAYLTRKENAEFIEMINHFEVPHETVEYENYYLFYFAE